MKKCLCIILLFYLCLDSVFSQVKVEKIPIALIPKKHNDQKTSYTPDFPLKDQIISDLYLGIQKATSIENSLNIGKNLDFNVNFDTIPTILKDGKIYKEIEISSPNSNTLSVNFSEIILRKSSKLYIINDEESFVLGPISSDAVSRTINFDPGFIPGDKIRILLEENEDEINPSKITISKIGHIVFDFFGLNKFNDSKLSSNGCTGFGCSATCLQNINCFLNLSLESKAVALISYTDPLDTFGNIGFHGTGFLVNNGSQNKRALFLAMIHGIGGYMVPDLKFIFHYRSPQCNPTTSGPSAFFVQGATQLGLDTSNDRRLLELTTNPGTSSVFASNPVSYLGWTIVDEPISSIYGIGHPKADVQKYMAGSSATPFIEPDQSFGVWKYRLTSGFPETNSSGSPTLNSSKRVIGSLYGAQSELTCSNFSNYDVYSVRISRSWALLCQHLDPNNEGIVALNSIIGTSGPKIFPSATGPNTICSSSIMTLANAPLDLQVNWSIIQGSNLLNSPLSGQGKSATVSPINSVVSGTAKIRFTVNFNCSTKHYDKTFHIGKPEIPTITILGVSPYGAIHARVDGNHVPPYKWYVNGSLVLTTSSSNVEMNIPGGSCGVTRLLAVSTANSCGETFSESRPEHFYTIPCFSYSMFPNPVSDELTIEQDLENEELMEIGTAFEVKIFDGKGNELHAQKSDKKSIKIDVRKLKPGFYYVHIIQKEGIIRKQIKIER